MAIIERLLPPSFFAPDLQASRVDQMVLDDLIEQHAPKVHEKLVELGIDLASITFGWFLSLFTDCLPVEVSLSPSSSHSNHTVADLDAGSMFRVWDVFFVEGHDVSYCLQIHAL